MALTATQGFASFEMTKQSTSPSKKVKANNEPGKRKTQVHLETGITTGSNLSMGNYFSIGLSGVPKGPLKMGAFLSYNRLQLKQNLGYQNTSTFLRSRYPNGIRETRNYETRMIDYQIQQLNFYEIGIRCDYQLGSRVYLYGAVTLNFMQDIRGEYTDYSVDSTFEVNGSYYGFEEAREDDKLVQEFREVDFKGIGLEHALSAHIGGGYSFTKRLSLTSRLSLPLGELFPEKISYVGNAEDRDIVLTKYDSNVSKRPLFLRLGLAYTF